MGNQTIAPPFAPLMRTVCMIIMPTSESKNSWPLIDGPNGSNETDGTDETNSNGEKGEESSSLLSADDVACLSCAALYEASVDVPQTQAPKEMTELLCQVRGAWSWA